jgi:hypothetical protein
MAGAYRHWSWCVNGISIYVNSEVQDTDSLYVMHWPQYKIPVGKCIVKG